MGISSANFSSKELSCSCCGENKFNKETLIALQRLRDAIGKPISLSSAYRCPEKNSKVSSTGKEGPHTTGKAIDILCSGKLAHEILSFAMIRSNTWKIFCCNCIDTDHSFTIIRFPSDDTLFLWRVICDRA